MGKKRDEDKWTLVVVAAAIAAILVASVVADIGRLRFYNWMGWL